MYQLRETGNHGAITPVHLPDNDDKLPRRTVLPRVMPATGNGDVPPATAQVPPHAVCPQRSNFLSSLEQALLEQIIEAMHQRDARKITNAASLFQQDPERFNCLFKQLRGEVRCRGLKDFHMRFLMSKERDDGMFMVCFPGSVLPQVVVRLKRR